MQTYHHISVETGRLLYTRVRDSNTLW